MTKNIKVRNLLSLITNILIIIFELVALLDIFGIIVISSKDVFGGHRIEAFRYFTTLSNIVLLIASAVILVYNIINITKKTFDYPKTVVAFKYCATVLVSLTFLTTAFFLAPIAELTGMGYFSMFKGYIFYLHFLCPVLAIISILFFEPLYLMRFRMNFINVIPVVCYGALYVPNVLTGTWPDFYSFTFGEHYGVIPFVIIIMLAFTFGISFVEYKLSKKIQVKLYS